MHFTASSPAGRLGATLDGAAVQVTDFRTTQYLSICKIITYVYYIIMFVVCVVTIHAKAVLRPIDPFKTYYGYRVGERCKLTYTQSFRNSKLF